MFCPECGKEIDGDSKFCEYCGNLLESDTKGEPSVKKGEPVQKSRTSQNSHRPTSNTVTRQQKPESPSTEKQIFIVVGLITIILICSVLFYRISSLEKSKSDNPKSAIETVMQTPPDEPQRTSIDRVFNPKMIGADLRYFEQVTGPARQTIEEWKYYDVDDCEITATVVNGSVRSLRIDLTQKCTFDLNKFPIGRSGEFSPVHTMTFGRFDALTYGGGRFMASCLFPCGNAADPEAFEHIDGYRANGFLEVQVGAVLAGHDAIAAADIWEDAMTKGEGDDWISETQFNCGPNKYDAIAHDAFKNVRITSIEIGYDLIDKYYINNCK